MSSAHDVPACRPITAYQVFYRHTQVKSRWRALSPDAQQEFAPSAAKYCAVCGCSDPGFDSTTGPDGKLPSVPVCGTKCEARYLDRMGMSVVGERSPPWEGDGINDTVVDTTDDDEADQAERLDGSDGDGGGGGGGPAPTVAVKVFVTMLIKDLSDLDIIHGTFLAMMGVKLSWVDERMIGFNEEIPKDLWCPMFALPNAPNVSNKHLFEGARGVTIVDSSVGLLSFQKNISANFLSSFDIREFPFDEYSMNIRFNSSCLRDGRDATTFGRGCKKQGAQFHLIAGITPDQCPGAKSKQAFIIRDKSLGSHLPEHTILGVQHYEFVKKGVNTCSFISFGVCVRRLSNYYFYKVVVVLWLTTLLAYCAFFVPVFAVADRLELVFNIFIATMATLYTVNEALPKSAFLHRIDLLVMACLVMISLVCAETCLVSYFCIDEEGEFACDKHDAKRADMLFAWGSMAVYILYNAYLFLRKACTLVMTPADARPRWLPEHKVYTPLSKIFAIDIWADTIMKKKDPKHSSRPSLMRRASAASANALSGVSRNTLMRRASANIREWWGSAAAEARRDSFEVARRVARREARTKTAVAANAAQNGASEASRTQVPLAAPSEPADHEAAASLPTPSADAAGRESQPVRREDEDRVVTFAAAGEARGGVNGSSTGSAGVAAAPDGAAGSQPQPKPRVAATRARVHPLEAEDDKHAGQI
eukprot:g4657.t1